MNTQSQYADLNAAERFGFLLLPGFSMITFSAALEVLQIANQICGSGLYDWQVFSINGEAVMTDTNIAIPVEYALRQCEKIDKLVICGGAGVHRISPQGYAPELHRLDRNNIQIGATSTAAFLLARCGLLDGYRATIQWEYLDSFRGEFTNIAVSDRLFEIDRNRFSSGGGTASIDMMLALISDVRGKNLTARIADMLSCRRVRGSDESQSMPLWERLGAPDPLLHKAVQLMENHIEDPICIREISLRLEITQRHLERLFKRHFNKSPHRYYMGLRIEKARQLLRTTDSALFDIAVASGFKTAPHFSNYYTAHFNISPKNDRKPVSKAYRFSHSSGNTPSSNWH